MQRSQGETSDQAASDIREIDGRRRETMIRLAKYSAPAMLALLLSGKAAVAQSNRSTV